MVSSSMAVVPDFDSLMRNIFLTTLPEPLETWLEAFPALETTADVEPLSFEAVASSVVWLHQASSEQSDFETLQQQIQSIREQNPIARIIVIANQPNPAQTVAAIQAGALGACHAYATANLLAKVRQVVEQGGLWLGESVLQQLIQKTQEKVGSSEIKVDTLLAKLTRRERQVAEQVANGLTNKLIARELGITERTVKAHVASIFERLGAKDRLQLALMLNQK